MSCADTLSVTAAAATYPYLGSCGWYRQWLRHTLCHDDFPQAQGHGLTRTVLDRDITLSVPVEGGYRAMRHTLPPQRLAMLRLSGHADWQRVHPQAIKSIYGKAPYFSHFFDEMEHIYATSPQGTPLHEFTLRMHRCLTGIFSIDILSRFMEMKENRPGLFHRLARERMEAAPADMSLLHALFYLGPELPFVLF